MLIAKSQNRKHILRKNLIFINILMKVKVKIIIWTSRPYLFLKVVILYFINLLKHDFV